jgi:D-serine deaminase-like pyridoxal phosphate-dependent protein
VKVRPEQQAPLMAAQNEILERALEALERAGLACAVVSGGSTPSWANSHLMPRVNEIRPGTYIFNDRNTVYLGAARPEDCALSVLVTVVSTAVDKQLIIDGGSKTFSSDPHVAGTEYGFGEVLGRPDLLLTAMTEEHGHVAAPHGLKGLRVGDRLRLVMNHACACMHLHEQAYLHRGEEVAECCRVAGRGKLQ